MGGRAGGQGPAFILSLRERCGFEHRTVGQRCEPVVLGVSRIGISCHDSGLGPRGRPPAVLNECDPRVSPVGVAQRGQGPALCGFAQVACVGRGRHLCLGCQGTQVPVDTGPPPRTPPLPCAWGHGCLRPAPRGGPSEPAALSPLRPQPRGVQ